MEGMNRSKPIGIYPVEQTEVRKFLQRRDPGRWICSRDIERTQRDHQELNNSDTDAHAYEEALAFRIAEDRRIRAHLGL